MIVPLEYVTTFPAARNASTCDEESGVRIIWRRSSPIVSTQDPQVGLKLELDAMLRSVSGALFRIKLEFMATPGILKV
jgi:hypothetical protein